MIAPYDATKLKVTVSEVNDRRQRRRQDRLERHAQTAPSARSARGSRCRPRSTWRTRRLIWSEAAYTYKPTIGYVITGTMNLTDQIYMRPRLSDAVRHARPASVD